MGNFLKNLKKLALSQHQKITLNEDGLEIIIMKPSETVMLELGRKLEESVGLLSKLKDQENLKKLMEVVEKLLTESIRHPDDYRGRLIVSDTTEEPMDFQEKFSDFNPKISNESLLKQKLITQYEFDMDALNVGASKITLFLLILRMMGMLRPQTEAPKKIQEEELSTEKKEEDDPEKKKLIESYDNIESFPGNVKGSEEISNS
jgi:predicted house-cleaning noncanonical NTP pyrophosphatase (MazG superfamily)